MTKKGKIIIAITSAAVAAVVGMVIALNSDKIFAEKVNSDFTVNYDGIKTASIRAGVSVHDPSILKAEGTYYIFGSHMSGASSTDLRTWTSIGNGYTPGNPLFDNLFATDHVFDYAGSNISVIPTDDGGRHVWAPDVIYNKAQGLYYMYFCTTSTWNASNLCYATSKNPEGPYAWQGALIYSGFTEETLAYTDVTDYVTQDFALENYVTPKNEYNFNEYPNAIDPAVFYDEEGRLWMVYGSWSGGIFLLELDESTGEVIHPEADPANNVDAYYGKKLIGGGHKSIEGPYILYDARSGYYYLFVSYGGLESDGGYQIRQYRSENPQGPYVDPSGKTLDDEDDHYNYGLKMMGNYTFPSLDCTYMAPGGQSTFVSTDGGRYITYHQRFDDGSEYHEPRVHQMFLNEEGWYVAAPFAASGASIETGTYDRGDISGTFYIVNHGTDIGSKVHRAAEYTFAEDGTITGEEASGTFAVKDGTAYIDIDLDGKVYHGVIIEMDDEAGNPVRAIMAAGESNETIWCVQYQ